MISYLIFGLLCMVQHAVASAAFAHVIVGNAIHFSQDDWNEHIQAAQDAHIDAFVLNMASADPANNVVVPAAFTAANNYTDFYLFFSFDYAANGNWSDAEVVSLINEYKTNPSYFLHDSKPLVSTFEGAETAKNWSMIKNQTECYFVPEWSSIGPIDAVKTGVVDGLLSWDAWPAGPNEYNVTNDWDYVNALNGSTYIMPISPWFYTNLPGYDKNWLWRGDQLWIDRWQQATWIWPEYIEIISWNDFGESHYIGPSSEEQYISFAKDTGDAPINYAAGMPHDGWRAFLPFLIDTWKHGWAIIPEESVSAWYRLSPSDACGTGNTTGNTASQGEKLYPPGEVSQDVIYYMALLEYEADVSVTIGSHTQPANWTGMATGQYGIFYGSVPFDGQTGNVTVELSRNGQVFNQMKGNAITTKCQDNITNWNAWVGQGKSVQQTAGSASGPTTSLPSVVASVLVFTMALLFFT